MKHVTSAILLCIIIIFELTGCKFSKNIPEPVRKSDLALDAEKTDNSLELIKQKGEIVIGVQTSDFPICYKNEKGDIDGFEIDIAKAIAQVMNVKVEFKVISPDDIISELSSNSIDFAWGCVAPNFQSHESILYSNPYFKSSLIFAVDRLSGLSTDELKGKTVGLKSSGAAYESFSRKGEVFDLIEDSQIKKYSDDLEALSDLEKGKISAVVLDKYVFNYYAKDKKDTFYILNEAAEEREYSIGARPGDKALMMELDSAIQKIKDNGTANIISQNWFGNNGIN